MRKEYSLWANLDKLIIFLKSIARDGKAPVRSEFFRQIGMDVNGQLQKYGGYKEVVKAAGLEVDEYYSKKRKSYWSNLDNITSYLKSIAINGKMPNVSEIIRRVGEGIRKQLKKYGGYRKVVEDLGLEIDETRRALDGHVLSSYYEMLFDDYLFLNNITHETEGFICNEFRARYDFKIGDVYVEIWGITDEASKRYNNYQKRRVKKEALYKQHNLKLISIEGNDFKRSSSELQELFKLKLSEYDIQSQDAQPKYPVFNRRKLGYWNEETVIKEIQDYIKQFGKFPTSNSLLGCREDLRRAIQQFGGYRKFARMMGFKPQTLEYSEERVLEELKEIMKSIGHFPCDRELQEMNRFSIAGSIKLHGGYGYFREKLLGQRAKRPYGYWKDEDNIVKELESLVHSLGHLPKFNELGLISTPITKTHKGLKYFLDKLNTKANI